MNRVNNKSCVVIGAGIVGLSTAVCLQKAGFSVTIIADRFDADTTSHVAGGVFLPYNRDVLGSDRRKEAIEVVKRGWKHYKSLWRTSPKHTGVMKTFGHQCYFTNRYGSTLPGEPLVWEVLEKLRELSPAELSELSPHLPCSGWLVQTFIIQAQYYLRYLMDVFKSGGGRVIQRLVGTFDELPNCDMVVNCCGLGARELCGDGSIYPGQGQVAHVIAPHVKNFFHCEEVYYKPPEERKLLYILPQTNHIVVGGTYTEYSDTTLCDEDIKRDFMSRLSHVVPSLKTSEIISERCGVRPCRSTIRLEKEQITTESGRRLKVVHNYGHGGNGIALSWGTAELAAEQAVSMVNQNSKL